MGDRILLSGTQIGMLIGTFVGIRQLVQSVTDGEYQGYPNTPGVGNPAHLLQSIDLMKKELEKALNEQSIGNSKNMLEEDVQDLTNLFASWIGRIS